MVDCGGSRCGEGGVLGFGVLGFFISGFFAFGRESCGHFDGHEEISVTGWARRAWSLLAKEKDRVITITADNGSEFHNDKKVEKALDTEVYFALPHHAWERGSNENTNGLIREYLPKGRDLSGLAQKSCTWIAEILNNRPRKRLGLRSPNEVYDDPSNFALQT